MSFGCESDFNGGPRPWNFIVGRVGQRGNKVTLCGILDWLQALVVKPAFPSRLTQSLSHQMHCRLATTAREQVDECRLPTPPGDTA